MSNPKPKELTTFREVLELSQTFLIIVIAVAYATGFLTIFSFLERFGLKEPASDLFRARYIYVGLLYLWMPFTVIIPVAGLLLIHRHRSSSANRSPIRLSQRQNNWELRVNFALMICVFITLSVYLVANSVTFAVIPFGITLIVYLISAVVRRGRWSRRHPLRADSKGVPQLPVTPLTVFITINLSTLLYIYIAFTPSDLTSHFIAMFDKSIITSVLGVYLSGWVAKRIIYPYLHEKYQKKPVRSVFPKRFRYCCIRLFTRNGTLPASYWLAVTSKFLILSGFVIVLCRLDAAALPTEVVVNLGAMILGGGWKYIGFLLLALFTLSRVYLAAFNNNDHFLKIIYWLIGVTLATSLCYKSVLSFSECVYPYIPVTKGGGDYCQAALVEFYLSRTTTNDFPQAIVATASLTSRCLVTIPVVLIEESSSMIYIANPNDPKLGGRRRWTSGYTPNVVAIPRERVISAVYLNVK